MGISKRLKFIADMVTTGNTACDVGTDHGFVPAYLLQENICPKVIAVDVSPGSLAKAKELAERRGLTDRMECRLSDGFEKLAPFEVDTVIIAGMGGLLMTRIMDSHPDVLASLDELILSPHRDHELVRSFIQEHGFQIVSDEVIADKKKTYHVIKAVNSLKYTDLK